MKNSRRSRIEFPRFTHTGESSLQSFIRTPPDPQQSVPTTKVLERLLEGPGVLRIDPHPNPRNETKMNNDDESSDYPEECPECGSSEGSSKMLCPGCLCPEERPDDDEDDESSDYPEECPECGSSEGSSKMLCPNCLCPEERPDDDEDDENDDDEETYDFWNITKRLINF